MKIDKVMRIPMDSNLFYDEISDTFTEWWYNLADLEENKKVFRYVKKYYPEVITAFKEEMIDFVSIYSDID